MSRWLGSPRTETVILGAIVDHKPETMYVEVGWVRYRTALVTDERNALCEMQRGRFHPDRLRRGGVGG